MKYRIVCLFIITYIFGDTSLGYSSGSPLYTHLTYIFQHATILHLAINSISFLSISRLLSRRMSRWTAFYMPCAIAVISSFIPCCIYPVPTVGASAVIYAQLGIYLAVLCAGNKNISAPPLVIKRRKTFPLLFAGAVMLSLAVSFFKQNSNFCIHAISFLCGCCAIKACCALKIITARQPKPAA